MKSRKEFIMSENTFNKEELERLYSQRMKEHEDSVRLTTELRGDARASLRIVTEKIEQIDKRVLEFYNIEIPNLEGKATLDELKEFERKVSEVVNKMGYHATEYLKTFDIKHIESLPPIFESDLLDILNNNNSLPELTTEQQATNSVTVTAEEVTNVQITEQTTVSVNSHQPITSKLDSLSEELSWIERD